ncbi:bifunctional phosphopantothenoylcysteine decarboxylase/phosphopantothenate--cysteine ligase CoaBC [Thermovibrio ammonificans]
MIAKRKIVLGVTGSIAAYKAVELLRALQKKGAEVRVAQTPAACRFVSSLTFEAISGYPVYTEVVPESSPEIRHTTLSSWGELLVVAPATANTIAKIAHGIADTSVSELALCMGKGIVCPAMNVKMFENRVTQENLQKLKELGWEVVEPEEGYLACGEVGKGRLAATEEIVEAVEYWFTPKLLKGKKVVVTAGPTREYIDPVRFISNPSSGKMGYAVAKAAAAAGAEVTLISGPTCLKAPYRVKRVEVESVEEMREAALKAFKEADVYISAAAIGDYRPKERHSSKIKKGKGGLILELVRTPDILREVASLKREGQVVVGFAAETDNVIENAREKLFRKRLDAVVANSVRSGVFGSDSTRAFFITAKECRELQGSKEEVALKIVELTAKLLS